MVPKSWSKSDPSSPSNYAPFYQRIREFPERLKKSYAQALSQLPEVPPPPYCYFGMGGSRVAGALAEVLFPELPLVDGYHAPQKGAAIFLSYSGETVEVLWEAEKWDGPAVCISRGGTLKALARRKGFLHLEIAENFASRFALPELLGAVLAVLRRANLLTTDLPRTWAPRLHAVMDTMEQQARHLAAETPSQAEILVFAAFAHLAPVVHRWTAQVAENAKIPALMLVLPEGLHNLLVPLGLGTPRSRLIALRQRKETSQQQQLWQALIHTLQDLQCPKPLEVRAPHPDSRTLELLAFILLGDIYSIALAERRQVEVLPVPPIDLYKNHLRREIQRQTSPSRKSSG